MKNLLGVAERFTRYVQIDTQADPNSETSPSTEKQKNLSRLLAEELKAMGIEDAHTDEWGYVYATIPANTDKKNVPVICFCSHVDTAPDCSGTDVKPRVHFNYQGEDIAYPDDATLLLRPSEHPNLLKKIGHDIVTASGLTLLGSDDKSGVAEIMDAAEFLMKHPDVKHGVVKILFTPDEEVGRGTEHVDLEKLGADFGYTLDGGEPGELEDETFSADMVKIKVTGVSAHPGYAKGKMENAMKIVADLIASLPKEMLTPETTSGMEGFIHPVSMGGVLEHAEVAFIIRDFRTEGLVAHEDLLKVHLDAVMKNYPNSKADFQVVEQYRNMKEILDQHPNVVQNVIEAYKRIGLEPIMHSIRGGTDGSRLSFMGLPCPNLFAGENAIHSRLEWVSAQDMQKASDGIVEICKVWEEKS